MLNIYVYRRTLHCSRAWRKARFQTERDEPAAPASANDAIAYALLASRAQSC